MDKLRKTTSAKAAKLPYLPTEETPKQDASLKHARAKDISTEELKAKNSSVESLAPEGSLAENKSIARQYALAQRDAIDPLDRRHRSQDLCHKLEEILKAYFSQKPRKSHPQFSPCARTLISVPTIALYNAMKSEVDLAELAKVLNDEGWRVCYPLMLKSPSKTDDTLLHPVCEDQTAPLPSQVCASVNNKPLAHENQVAPLASIANTDTSPGKQPAKIASFCKMSPTTPMAFFTLSSVAPAATSAHQVTQSEKQAQDILAHPLRRHSLRELEAAGFTYVAPVSIDAIVVPLVAFDSTNHRLGYGGGNYDNYLPLLRKDCLITGVAFREQQINAVPLEPHDLSLPSITVG